MLEVQIEDLSVCGVFEVKLDTGVQIQGPSLIDGCTYFVGAGALAAHLYMSCFTLFVPEFSTDDKAGVYGSFALTFFGEGLLTILLMDCDFYFKLFVCLALEWLDIDEQKPPVRGQFFHLGIIYLYQVFLFEASFLCEFLRNELV